MIDLKNAPWTGIALAVLTAVGLLVSGFGPLVVFGVLVVWIGTLWIATPPPPPPGRAPEDGMKLTHDGMRNLLENSGLPLLLVDRRRILIANKGARKVLGGHILAQDVRIAFRHPAAIELLDREENGSVTIPGLTGARSIWQLNRYLVDDRYSMIELINRTAEADISRAHTDFVANASHELRTPLASIIGYCETLTDEGGEDVPPETRQRFLGTVLREAKRLQNLVDDLMSLSRVEAEKHEQPSERFGLAAIVSQSARDAAGSERLKKVELDVAEGDLEILGDRQQMEQLVRNLVDNALKYGDRDQPITVSLEPGPRKDAILRVRDRGEGIAAEHLPHLTRRFYRTDPGRSRAAGGTGLGLAIVKHIVERHRGQLDISSVEGEGTTVTVSIPLAE